MTGVLNYAAPAAKGRGMTFGVVSTCLATSVFALPSALFAISRIVEKIFSRPGHYLLPQQVGLLLVVIPTIAMLLFPMAGLLLGTVGVLSDRRRISDYVKIGLIANLSALLSAVGMLLFY